MQSCLADTVKDKIVKKSGTGRCWGVTGGDSVVFYKMKRNFQAVSHLKGTVIDLSCVFRDSSATF